MNRKLLLVAVGLLLLISTGAASAQSSGVVIGLSLPTAESVFSLALVESAQKTADSLGAKLVVMDAKGDLDTEAQNVNALVQQKVSALLFTPVDANKSLPDIKLANDASIPVFIFGAPVQGVPLLGLPADDAGADTLAAGNDSTTTDVFTAMGLKVAGVIDAGVDEEGALAAQTLCDKLGGQGTVLELQSFPAAPIPPVEDVALTEARARSTSLTATLTDKCPDIKVQTVDALLPDKKSIQDAYLAAIKGADIKGVIAYNDLSALSAVEANVVARKAGVTLLTFDASEGVLGAIEAGRLSGAIAPDPTRLGESGVQAVVDYLKTPSDTMADVNVPPTVLDAQMVEAVRGGRKLS